MIDHDIRFQHFTGPSEEEDEEARRRYREHRRRQNSTPMEGGRTRYIGTPRHAKHKGSAVEGVRIR